MLYPSLNSMIYHKVKVAHSKDYIANEAPGHTHHRSKMATQASQATWRANATLRVEANLLAIQLQALNLDSISMMR